MTEIICHEFEPVYDMNSRVLILGTMPSSLSRANGFYYSNPQNRFWKVLSVIFGRVLPLTANDKREMILSSRLALWDVVKSCEINGSDDASIRNYEYNNIFELLQKSNISYICTTGRMAAILYKKYASGLNICQNHIELPSTSPANCRYYTYERLVEFYGILPQLVEN